MYILKTLIFVIIRRWKFNFKFSFDCSIKFIAYLVSLGISPTRVLKLDSWSLGAGFIPIISTKGIIQINKGKLKEKKSFMYTKRFNTFFKTWVQFRVGAIPRLPNTCALWLDNKKVIFLSFPFLTSSEKKIKQ